VTLFGFVQRVQQLTADDVVVALAENELEQSTAALRPRLGGSDFFAFVAAQRPAAGQLLHEPEVRFHRGDQLASTTLDATSRVVRRLDPVCNRNRR